MHVKIGNEKKTRHVQASTTKTPFDYDFPYLNQLETQ